MQSILGNAMANYNYSKVEWCQDYMILMRSMIFKKYDEVSAHILEYIEEYTKYTNEEMIKL